jgi:hypothetical protein
MTPERGTRIATWAVVAGLAAVAAVVVFGVPARSLILPAAALICPVSMLFMHGAHDGHSATAGQPEHHHADRPTHHGAPEHRG